MTRTCDLFLHGALGYAKAFCKELLGTSDKTVVEPILDALSSDRVVRTAAGHTSTRARDRGPVHASLGVEFASFRDVACPMRLRRAERAE